MSELKYLWKEYMQRQVHIYVNTVCMPNYINTLISLHISSLSHADRTRFPDSLSSHLYIYIYIYTHTHDFPNIYSGKHANIHSWVK